ncbi:MAG: hypothetical protein ACRDQ2_10075 [Gaiellales bacterium]
MTVHTRVGGSARYAVVTWLTEEKAIAMAVAAHLRRHPDGEETYDVEVEDLGPVDRDAQGAMVLERSDLTDRAEF